MFKPEQQRPSRQEFEAAAFRFEENQYPEWWESSRVVYALARLGSMFTFRPVPGREPNMKKHDVQLMGHEQMREGYAVGEEDLAVFARKRLERYRRSQKP